MEVGFLRTLFRAEDVFEVRTLGASCPGWRTPHTESGYFDYEHIDDIPGALDALAGYAGIYVTINPVNPDLLARASNRLAGAQRNATTSDGDILTRRWLFLDIDPERPSGISATDAEKREAHDTAIKLRDLLTGHGWPKPIEVDSGNGYYLLYRIDLPSDDGGLVSRVLKGIASMVQSDTVHIDTSVANAARIARVPGTWNRKGDNVPVRPHRLAQVVTVPQNITTVLVHQLDALAIDPVPDKPKRAPITGSAIRPGDVYNESADLPSLLLDHGWQMVGDFNGNQQWRRPGKMSGNHSATYNGSVFYVFSSAAAPFEANTGYSPFQAYTLLNHNGNHRDAARTLAQDGYKDPLSITTYPEYPGVDLSDFLSQFDPAFQERYKSVQPFPKHLLQPPGFLGEVIQYNMETAPKPQPILALAGALALQAILCARKVKTVYGTRPNLMLCGVAPSGAGKEHARSLNRQILVESGLAQLHAEGIKSGSALVNALAVNPALLFQLDEYGRFLKASRNPERNPYAYEIISKLLTLFSSSGALYETDRYADREKGGQRIQDPHAIVYGTTVPRSLYEGLTEESVTDGFLARTLIFDVDGNHPLRRILPEKPIPEIILERAKWWANYNPGGGNLNPEPRALNMASMAQKIASDFILTEANKIKDLEDSPLATLWTRTAQNADKLALLYTVSNNPEAPEVSAEATKWGYDTATFLTERMIYLIGENVASSPFHNEVLKVKRILERSGGKLTRNELLRKTKIRSRELDEIIDYLIQSKTVTVNEVAPETPGPKPREYSLS